MDTLGVALVPPKKKMKIIHLVTGDGVATNEAALKRVLGRAVAGDLPANVEYRLINWVCASHVVNLVVEVAVCRKRVQQPEKNGDLCCAASRFVVPT